MTPKGRPINAEVPAAKPGEKPPQAPKKPAEAEAARSKPVDKPDRLAAPAQQPTAKPPSSPAPPPPPKPPAAPKRRRRPVPAALKAIGGLVLVAVVFIVAAILGGGGSEEGGSIPGAAPTGESPTEAKAPPTQPASELGYPEFATNNTTRVGGPDPASNAAGVALAVYPSTDDAQRPSTVTLVNADDWQSSIAAAVLMAEPLRSPLLLSETDGLPEATSAALDALEPAGAVDGSAQVFAIGGAGVPSDLKSIPVKATGAAGAAAIAKLRDKLFDAPPRHVLVVPSAEPAFAMPAAAWSARSGDPVLFTGKGKLPTPTAAALKRHSKVPVYVLGPSSAISSDVVREIAEIDGNVSRVSGEDPVANAIALARYADGEFGWNVNDPGHGFVIARSDSPLDAVAAAPLSASGTWGPLLLTDSADTLPAALRDYLLDVKPGYTTDPTRAFYNHVWVIGDRDALDVSQQAEIDELAELARIGGTP